MSPYRLNLMICAGTGCVSNRSFHVKEALDRELQKHNLQKEVLTVMTGCNGFCAAGPIMIVQPDGIFYQFLKEEDIPHLVEEHFLKGRPVKRLMYTPPAEAEPIPKMGDISFFKKQILIALRNKGIVDPEKIDDYIAREGYAALGKTLTEMTPEEVIKEIETFKEGKIIVFVDDNIVGKLKYAKELFRALIPYKIKWVAQTSVTIARDDELLKLAAASGCISLFIGFESISPASLVAVGKKINVVDEYEKVIRKIHSHGIAIHGFFIFGFDEDDESVFRRTVHFAQKMRLESAQFDFLTPYPGTAFGKYMDEAGRIITKDWSQYGCNLVFEPKQMSREILQRSHDQAWYEFYSIPSIWRRLGLAHRHLWMFWIVNLYYRAHWRTKFRAYKDRGSSTFLSP